MTDVSSFLQSILQQPFCLCATGIALSIAGAVFASTAKALSTTRQGALDALKQNEDFIKWLAAIETAVLGGLAAFVFGGEDHALRNLDPYARSFAVASTVLLGLALIFAGWVLTSLGSVTAHIHRFPAESRSVRFDILKAPLAARCRLIRLGFVKTAHHYLWVCGIGLAAACVVQAARSASAVVVSP